MVKYVLDNNIISRAVLYKLLNLDKVKGASKVKVTCSRLHGTDLYTCRVDTDKSHNINSFIISNSLVNSLRYSATHSRTFQNNNIVEMEFGSLDLSRLEESNKFIEEKCKNNTCLTTPEIPYISKNGKISSVIYDVLDGRKPIPDHNNKYNKIVEDLIKKYNIKILVNDDIVPKDIYNDVKRYLQYLFGSDYIAEDKIDRVYRIQSNDTIVVYDSGNSTITISSNGNVKSFKVTEDVIKNNKALEKVLNVIRKDYSDVDLINEAIKSIKNSDINNNKFKIFYPEKSYIDSYLQSIAHDDVYVVTGDRDIKGISVSTLPAKKENIIYIP